MSVNWYDLENIRHFPLYIAIPIVIVLLLLYILGPLIEGKINELSKPHKTKLIWGLVIILAFIGAYGVGLYVGSYGEKLEIAKKILFK